jgi:intein/homing endonuclease
VAEIHASKEIVVVVVVITIKNSNTWNVTHNTKVFQSETRSLSSGDHCWFKRNTRKNKPVTRDLMMVMMMMMMINHSDST